MHVADALSISLNKKGGIGKNKIDEAQVMDLHIKHNHRKANTRDLENLEIIISKNRLSDILEKCEICARKSSKFYKAYKYVESEMSDR